MGQRERSGIIEDLEAKDNAILLVLKDGYAQNWQMPKLVINHVKKNFKKVDSIEIFDIYTKM